MIQIVDSHCHLDMLDLSPYQNNLQLVIDHAKDHGVVHLLNVCVNLERFNAIKAQAEQFANVSCSFGLHPSESPGDVPSVEDIIFAADHPEVVAIGETGLDYHYITGNKQWQNDRFRNHIRAAIACKKPLIIHTRAAKKETIQILREEQAELVGGVMHCFTEDWEMAQDAIELGFYISFSGIVTFKKAKNLQEVAKQVPLSRMLIETDSPYLTPTPFRGKPNYPGLVRYVCEFIAQLRETSVEEIARHTTANFFKLFSQVRPAVEIKNV